MTSEILAAQHAEVVLQWYLDNGVDEAVVSDPVNRLIPRLISNSVVAPQAVAVKPLNMAGAAELKSEALKLVSAATTLEELKEAISGFDGLSLKKTAMNMVFAAGNASAAIMVIGDAPEAEDDRAGIPFSGEVGALTDKMFAAIGLSRHATEANQSIYLTNVLNWRPPGNRSPLAPEIELSIPFIRRHIELIKPKMIYVMGGVANKAILGSDLAISKMRGKMHVAKWDGFECPAMVSYHPSYLLKSPLKKKEAWEDLLLLKEQDLQ